MVSKDEIVKHWLLTSAIGFPRGLSYFFPEVDGLALNMKEIPGCNYEDYAKGLLALYDSGMIEFSSKYSEDNVTDRSCILKILDRFLIFSKQNPTAQLHRRVRRNHVPDPFAERVDLRVNFNLTVLGGIAWEKIAEPSWSHFFGQSNDDETGEIFSQNLTLLIARLGWFIELAHARIHIDTIELQTHSDYQVLYWKTLPDIHRATFSLQYEEPRWANGRPGDPKWFRDWWHSMNRWHKQPWDLPGWPR